MKYYHGTNYEAGINILRHGFAKNTIWSCSNPSNVYMICEQFENDDHLYTEMDDLPALRFAIEAAQIAAAYQDSKCEAIFVFEFDIPDEMTIEPDSSCENMYDCYEIDCDTLNTRIQTQEITITTYLFHHAYVPYLRIFYLKQVNKNYMQLKDPSLRRAIESIRNVETFWFYDDFVGIYEDYEIYKKGNDTNENRKLTEQKSR